MNASHYPDPEDYIDIHSHKSELSSGVFRIYNMFLQDFQTETDRRSISTGLHPWHLEGCEDVAKLKDLLENAVSNESVIALGETGLDKIIKTDLDRQIEIFRIHVEIAEKNNIPLIIHCVKAYQEIVKIRKEMSVSGAWILHGFNSSAQMAGDMTEKGIYISAGTRLLGNKKKCREVLNNIPSEFLFLETDEDDVSIKKVYSEVSECMDIPVSELKKIIYKNFQNAFVL